MNLNHVATTHWHY